MPDKLSIIDSARLEELMPSSYVIGEHFERFVQDQIGSGRFGSASEVMRHALRLMEEREQLKEAKLAQLRLDVQKGMSGRNEKLAKDVFSDLRERIKQIK